MIDRPWPGAPTTPSMSMAIKLICEFAYSAKASNPRLSGDQRPQHATTRSVGLSLAGLHRACLSAVQQFGHRCTPFTSLKTCCHFNLKPKHRLDGITKTKNTPELTASICPLLPAGCHKLLHWKWNCTRWFTLMETGHTEIPAPPAGLAVRIVAHKSGPLRVWMSGWEVVNSS